MGTRVTVQKMADLVREALNSPAFREWAEANLPATLADLDAFVRQVFRYRAESSEVLRTVFFMVEQLERDGFFEGDCDDASIFIAACARAMGYLARLVAIRYQGPEFEHVFVEALDQKPALDRMLSKWISIDPTVPRTTKHEELERMVIHV